jgi:tetratricopeptide (TPR) repeat protein
VHLLTHVNVPDLPAWLDEGISEFWATAVVQSDGMEIGRPALHHLKTLRARRSWIPLDQLLATERAPDARDSQRLSMFYAQSWALTHYVMLRDSSTDSVVDLGPSKYVERLRGANAVEAGTLAFGDLSQVERALAAYVHEGRFRTLRVEIAQPEIASAWHDENPGISVRALSAAQSLAVRAGFLVDGERPAGALPLLREALAADPEEVTALETLGYLHFRQNNAVEAAKGFDRAIETGRASYLAYFYRAILSGSVPKVRLTTSAKATAVKKPDPTYGTPEDLLRRAIDLNPTFAEAYVRLADVYTQETGRLEEALPLMRRATEIEPDNAGYWLDFGKLLLGLNRPDEARDMGRRGLAVAAWSESSRCLLEAFLAGLDS